MASSDARPIPRKNSAYRVTFPIFDADGDLVSGAAGLDSEVSVDGGAFTDCTNEAIEIATSSGMYYLDLTSSEMNGDTVAIIVKTSTSGAKTTPIVIYPEEAGDIRANVTQVSDDTTAAENLELMFDGTGYAGGDIKLGVDMVAISGDSVAADNLEAATDGNTYNLGGGAIVAASVTGTVGGVASGGITAASIAADAIGASELAADAVAEIADAVWDELTSGHTTSGTFGEQVKTDIDEILTDTGTTLDSKINTIDDFLDTEVAAILEDTGTTIPAQIAALNNLSQADVRTAVGLTSANLDTQLGGLPTAAENADAVWNEAISGHLESGSTGAALNAAGAAGDPWSTEIPGTYGAGTAGYVLGNNIDATISSRASQTSLNTIDDFLDTEVAAILEDTGTTIPSQIAALNNLSAAQVNAEMVDVLTVDVLEDSVSADGSRPTIGQALLMIVRFLMEKSVSGTTVTIRKEDGSTTAMTLTLNDGTNPTSITRAS